MDALCSTVGLRIIIHRSTFCLVCSRWVSFICYITLISSVEFSLSLFLFVIYLRSDKMRGNQGGTLPGRRDNITRSRARTRTRCPDVEIVNLFLSFHFCARLLNARFSLFSEAQRIGLLAHARQIEGLFFLLSFYDRETTSSPFLSFQGGVRRK